MDSLTQDVVFPLEIAASFFNNLTPDIIDFLIAKGVPVPPRMKTEPITRETRVSFWSEMRQWKQKVISEQ